MKLSKAEQQLLNTDFGELDKIASEQVKVASEMYNYGASMADQVIEQIDALVKKAEDEEEEEDEEELSEEDEKTAAECGAFIEAGFSEKLAQAGLDNHGDSLYYFKPYLEQYVADEAVKIAAGRFDAAMKAFGAKVKGLAAKGKGKAQQAGAKGKALAGKAKAKAQQAGAKAKDVAKKPAVALPGAALGGAGLGYYLGQKRKG